MAKKKNETATAGHNSGDALGQASQEQLKSLERRIMTLMSERDDIAESIKEVFEEAKDAGFDTKALRKAITRKRAMNKDEAKFKAEEEAMELYFAALYQPNLPFESLNPHMAEQRKKPAGAIKAIAAIVAPADPGAPTTDETEFV